MRANPILQTDAYKCGHWNMVLKGTTRFYSYLSSRIGAKHPFATWYGLQYYLKEYLEGSRITREDIEEANDVCGHVFERPNFNKPMWEHILHTYGGRLPLRICAWDEGEKVPTGFPMFTVVNTDPLCASMTNHFEPLLAKVWYPTTVATVSGHVISRLGGSVRKTGGPEGFERYMLHDFGYRGVSSEESAKIGGSAHLVHSNGTDTLQALPFARDYYGASLKGLGASVAASEHSIMTAGGPQREIEIAKIIIKNHPGQIVSLVADSYNYYEFVDAMIAEKAFVDQHKVRLVLRPDSITPVHKTPAEVVLWTLERYKERLGTTQTSMGYHVTPYGCLWGDGIGPDGIDEIDHAVVSRGFAAHNMVYGMGGGLLQRVDRDTERFAIKCSAQERDGQWHDIKKNPLDQSKASLSGRMQVVTLNGHDQIYPGDQWLAEHPQARLKPVFENGVILRQHTFDQIRSRARA